MIPSSVKTSPKIETTPAVNMSLMHVDVGGHARHQPADRVAVEEPQVEPLQVPVDLPAACRT